MKRQAHALVQDTDDADHVVLQAIDDHMRADQLDAVRFGEFGVCVTACRIA